MSLETKLIALAKAIGADIKTLRVGQGDLGSLPTTEKTNLVAAITELHGLIGSAGAMIDDSAGLGATELAWSADKIIQVVEAAKLAVKNDLIDGAGEALDTFKEFAEALGNDHSFAATIAEQISTRVRFDAAQVLTAPQKLQACTNIGVGDPDHDFVTDYVTAKG